MRANHDGSDDDFVFYLSSFGETTNIKMYIKL